MDVFFYSPGDSGVDVFLTHQVTVELMGFFIHQVTVEQTGFSLIR